MESGARGRDPKPVKQVSVGANSERRVARHVCALFVNTTHHTLCVPSGSMTQVWVVFNATRNTLKQNNCPIK